MKFVEESKPLIGNTTNLQMHHHTTTRKLHANSVDATGCGATERQGLGVWKDVVRSGETPK